MAREKTKSYEELLAERQAEWQAAQRKAEAELADLRARIARMPDVANGPVQDQLWGGSGVRCECSNEAFRVKRYVTVNGKAYRIQLECVACKGNRTWDFSDRKWIEPERFYLPDVGKG